MKVLGLRVYTNWPTFYKIWYYTIYLLNASKVWLLCIVHITLSINGKKENVSIYKTVHVER